MNKKGLSLVELCIVTLLFTIILFVIYSTLDVGLNMWKIGETRSDVQTKTETVMRRIVSELKNSNCYAIVFNEPTNTTSPYHSDTPYVCFDTPVYNGEVKYKEDTGDILWQGFVLYYAPQDPADPNFRVIYRRYVPHSTSSPYYSEHNLSPTIPDPNDVLTWINETPSLSSPGSGQSLTTCARVSSVNFNFVNSMVTIEFEVRENVKKSREAKVSYSGSEATAKYKMKDSVKPKN